jgi:hypothetical protein
MVPKPPNDRGLCAALASTSCSKRSKPADANTAEQMQMRSEQP